MNIYTLQKFKNKHQIVVSKTHPIASLTIQEIQQKNLHIGREHTLSILREKNWIPSCREITRKLINDSLYCKLQNAKPDHPIMGNLQSDRTKMANKPFSNVGVNYFRPIIVKLSKQKRSNAVKTKRWEAIFTCSNTRAVHLELAKGLAIDSFLLSLRRFISRREEVRIIRSDNGSNFVGAEKKLKSCIRKQYKQFFTSSSY